MAQHAVRVAVIGGRVRVGKFGDAADPEPVLHGRDRDAPVGEGERTADGDARIGHHRVVASLRLERDPGSEPAGERLRPDARGEDQPIRRVLAGVGHDPGPGVAADGDGARRLAKQNAPRTHEMPGEDLGQAKRVHRPPDPGVVNGRACDGSEGGLHLARLVARKHGHFDAEPPAHFELERLAGQRVAFFVNREPARALDQILRARFGGKRRVGVEHPREKACAGRRNPLRPLAPARVREADEPRQRLREVTQADRQGLSRIEKKPRNPRQDSGHGRRHARRDPKVAGVARRAALARRVAVDQGDAKTGALKPKGRADAHDARADDNRVVPGGWIGGRWHDPGHIMAALERIAIDRNRGAVAINRVNPLDPNSVDQIHAVGGSP